MAKFRTGFVSNSSSSSFILFVPKTDATTNNIDNIKQHFRDDGYDDEDMEYLNLNLMQDYLNEGFGFVGEYSLEYGCDDVITRICKALGGKVIYMD